MNLKIVLGIALLGAFTSCDDVFEPAIENVRGAENLYEESLYAQGVLLNAYTRLPTNSWSFNDVATDDAVTNNRNNNFAKIATGQWTANNNPFDQWTNSRMAIQYINLFLENADKVIWAKDEKVNELFTKRLKGEAYGLRAYYMFHLLQNHAGIGTNGELLGVPILLSSETPTSDFNIPRATFEQCMQQIYADVAQAEKVLPLEYEEADDASQIPAGVDLADYNRVFSNYNRQRMSGKIAKVVRAQAALLAASPAFSSGNTTTYADVVRYAGELIVEKGGVSGIDAKGHTWYTNVAEIADMGSGVNSKETIWRVDIVNNLDLERDNFPPSLYGNGRINPTQNLVDAFPMANGYPINNPASNYDPSNPYAGRDPRLQLYILTNGATAGVNNTVINTAFDGSTNDALNKVETSTRTGYYLKKLLRQDVNLNPSSNNAQKHYKPRMRYTEVYLIYAEAANETFGPLGTGSYGISAYDVIAALRKRAGIAQPDAYLESIKSDQIAMRNLIRNERRLELCFEGFRFWDLRRWNENLTTDALGVRIEGGVPQLITVENRVFANFMNYGPIPYGETIKYSALQQNSGW